MNDDMTVNETATTDETSRRKLAIFLALIGVILLFSLASFVRNLNQPAETPGGSTGVVLAGGVGRGDKVSRSFTVYSSCPRQEIAYTGKTLDAGVDSSWVNFRAVRDDGRGGESLGPENVGSDTTGASVWTLRPGSYVVDIESYNASWTYQLKCR